MLNKGPFVVDAVRTLDGILRRMHGPQYKKRPLLRAWGGAPAKAGPATEPAQPAKRVARTPRRADDGVEVPASAGSSQSVRLRASGGLRAK
jgi:pyruvate kinase